MRCFRSPMAVDRIFYEDVLIYPLFVYFLMHGSTYEYTKVTCLETSDWEFGTSTLQRIERCQSDAVWTTVRHAARRCRSISERFGPCRTRTVASTFPCLCYCTSFIGRTCRQAPPHRRQKPTSCNRGFRSSPLAADMALFARGKIRSTAWNGIIKQTLGLK